MLHTQDGFPLNEEGPIKARTLPPFFKGGQGGLYNRLIIPLNPPLEKGDFKTAFVGPGNLFDRQFLKHDPINLPTREGDSGTLKK
jgi:hypothetical protein